MSLTLKQLSEVNLKRAQRWHSGSLDTWSIQDWLLALCGEVGEAANIGKKLRRLESKYESKNDAGRQIDSYQQAIDELGNELADSLAYLDLCATRCGINLEQVFIKKFNEISNKYGFEEKL